MSGISGIFNLDGRPVDRELLGRMTDVIAYRGPDRGGVWSDGPVGLGHRMLCTTPESLRETQPLRDERADLCLVMDGRVDNRDELRGALLARGARPRDDTDAELVLRAYEAWGEECPKHIVGDFAFAIWDGRRRQLFCARDFLGIKPFYYHMDGQTFRFGSELRQILEDSAVRRRPNEGMIGEYLANAITSQEETLYEEIMRLPPAHYLIVRSDRLSKQRYWMPDFSKRIRYRADEEYAEHFLAIFKEAIRCRLRSVGTVGIALSGGLDSSSIACVAQSLNREGSKDEVKLIAISEIFPGQDCDESAYIEEVVRLWDLDIYSVQRSDADPRIFIEQARRYLDFPGYPNGGMVDPVNALAQNHGLRVLLDGVGGDQWLTGTNYYYADLLNQQQVMQFVRQIYLDLRYLGVGSTLSQVLWYGISPLFPQNIRDAVKRVLRKDKPIPTWINTDFARRIQLAKRTVRSTEQKLHLNFAQRELWQNAADGFGVHSYELQDRAASWAGLERRHPFQDRRLVEYAFALPENQRCRCGWIKYILRVAMRDYLPKVIQQRWDKAEFSILFGKTLETSRIVQIFDQLEIETLGWVNGNYARDMRQKMLILYHKGDADYKYWVWNLWMITGVELWVNEACFNG